MGILGAVCVYLGLQPLFLLLNLTFTPTSTGNLQPQILERLEGVVQDKLLFCVLL